MLSPSTDHAFLPLEPDGQSPLQFIQGLLDQTLTAAVKHSLCKKKETSLIMITDIFYIAYLIFFSLNITFFWSDVLHLAWNFPLTWGPYFCQWRAAKFRLLSRASIFAVISEGSPSLPPIYSPFMTSKEYLGRFFNLYLKGCITVWTFTAHTGPTDLLDH